MKLVNMQQPKENETKEAAPAMDDQPRYPYGLQIRLGEHEIGKLGLDTMPAAGAKVVINAVASVSEVSQRETLATGKNDRALELQITDFAMEEAQDDPAKALYGKKG